MSDTTSPTAPAAGSVTFPALGSTAQVVTREPDELRAAHDAVAHVLAATDRACSRFRADSELSRVNASGGRFVDVSALLCDALAAALAAAVSTSGLVDPTVGRSLLALGYRRDFWSSTPASDATLRSEPAGRWREVDLDERAGRVRVPAGVSLDLGATAKAFAADRAAAAAALVADGVLVSLGGDIRLAGRSPEQGWVVHVTDDHRALPGAPGQTIALHGGGLATSSTTVRAWTRAGAPVHHIVDPSTGMPAIVAWRTVSVTAASCLEANVATTAAIVLGEGAAAWLAGRALPARLVRPSGAVTVVAGWPEDERAGSAR